MFIGAGVGLWYVTMSNISVCIHSGISIYVYEASLSKFSSIILNSIVSRIFEIELEQGVSVGVLFEFIFIGEGDF